MKVLVLYVHPYEKSFNHAILEQVVSGLNEGGHEHQVVDLYAINFDPVMKATDFQLMQQGKVSDDVMEQQQKLIWAEGIIIIHPIWWENHPAMLVGWFDRVLCTGFAYHIDEKGYHGLLNHIRKALFIMTAGRTEAEAVVNGVDICKRIFKDQRSLEFTGIPDVRYQIFYDVIRADDATRNQYLQEARRLAMNF